MLLYEKEVPCGKPRASAVLCCIVCMLTLLKYIGLCVNLEELVFF